MENLLDKLNKMTMVAIALLAVSISMINFQNLSFDENFKAYLGIFIVLLVFGARFYVKSVVDNEIKKS